MISIRNQFLFLCLALVLPLSLKAQKLENPMTVSYLQEHLTKTTPRLILTPEIEQRVKEGLQSDPMLQGYYQYLLKEAEAILEKPLLQRELQGFRLLFVSREFLERMGVLGMVYRLGGDPKFLRRIDAEVQTVCAFEDWNPQHFLDVSEMSLGVALAIDWVGQALPAATRQQAISALIEKGIKPSFNTNQPRMFWINSSNNWNAVCHGGMVAASLVIAEEDPQLAAKTIARALEKLPNSLKEYAPDGVYPEGPTYWGYGTSYTVLASSVLNSALGTDFGIAASPGFMESAEFMLQVAAPSGHFFNFADSGDRMGGRHKVLLSWFAAKTGDRSYLDQSFFEDPTDAGRFAGPALVWLAQFEERKNSTLARQWRGRGHNPVAIFRGETDEPGQFYLGVKGGKAHLSHGNMDAGTFVFDLDGVRWVLDPGNQSYYPLNRIGFNLAGHCQDCDRWTLLTKHNQGHSTITVNGERFLVDAHAPIIDFEQGTKPSVTIDLTDLYGENLNTLHRTVTKESNRSVLIEDQIEINDQTKTITWGLMTTAEVQLAPNGAVLRQDGKELTLSILSPSALNISVLSLDPPPLVIDKTIENLKRIEIRAPAYIFEQQKGMIRVRLAGEE